MPHRRHPVRWTADVHTVHAYATSFDLAPTTTLRIDTDAAGDVLEQLDADRGIAWRARVTDPKNGRWRQAIWALPTAGEPERHDPDIARLALTAAMLDEPTRTAEHHPHHHSGTHADTPVRWHRRRLSRPTPEDAFETYRTLVDEAELLPQAIAWETRFGLTGARLHGTRYETTHGVAHLGDYRLTMTRGGHGWILTVIDTHPTAPDEPAPHRWSSAWTSDPAPPDLPLPFTDTFAFLIYSLAPVDAHTPALPREVAALGGR